MGNEHKQMIVGIIQARTSSSRLPGKVLKPILGQPMLTLQLERLKRVSRMDALVVATSDLPEDDAIERLCRDAATPCFRGSLDDVLDRVHGAARQYGATVVVRLTADCPLTDPDLIDDLIEFFEAGDYDYASNTLEPTWPDGLDAEVMRFAVLETAWREAASGSEREHVTLFLYNHPTRFKLGSFKNRTDMSGLRWTVDEPEDFELVSQIYQALYEEQPAFGTADILAYLKAHPELSALNSQIGRNEGLAASLARDEAFRANAGDH